MMLRKRTVLFGLAVFLVGCAARVASNQVAESPQSPIPSTAQSAIAQTNIAQASILKAGSFVSGEHPTQGRVRIVVQGNQRVLELDSGFKTSNSGPDLVVALHRSRNVLGSTQPPAYPLKANSYIVLAPLQQFSGAQQYAIPTQIDLASFQSVVIWCRQFNATFGAAQLISQ